MANEPILNAPGILHMKCMIWEANPITERVAQDYTVIYNTTTLKSLPENIQRGLNSLDGPPYGIFLREKYVYRDVFLKIGNEVLNSERDGMRAENGERLFDPNGVPLFQYIEHQTFLLNGSLFSNKFATPTGIKQANVQALDNGLSKWSYLEVNATFEHDGHHYDSVAGDSNLHDYVDAIKMANWETGFEQAIKKSSLSNADQGYILTRKVRRFMPQQIESSSEQRVNSSSATSAAAAESAKPIHWLCLKEMPLYSGEDFFVEFRRLAYEHDIVTDSQPMIFPERGSDGDYRPIDAQYNNTSDTIIRNGAVVEVTEKGEVAKETINTFNLNVQPYYLIEIGKNSRDDHYFIILAYNSKPIFVHVGRFNVLKATEGKPDRVVIPPYDVSRRLSMFKNVSCKQLMDQEKLRITVRSHLGKIVVVFSGHEGTPWVISRTDYDGKPTPEDGTDHGSNDDGTIDLINVTEKPVPMEIAGTQMQVGGGNIKCGFTFGPLHYEEKIAFNIPNAITIKGPVVEKEITLKLCEDKTPSKQTYFQDAEVFVETIKGEVKETKKTKTDSIWPVKAFNKDCNPSGKKGNKPILNAGGEKISYISIDKTTGLGESPSIPPPIDGSGQGGSGNGGNPPTSDKPTTPPSKYLRWFNARFSMGSGDFLLPASRKPGWHLSNCITPVATGWKLYVPPNNIGHGQTPVNVAHHVETFSHSWSYSDNVKVEHNGNIKFRLNLGMPASLKQLTSTPTSTDGEPNNPPPKDTSIDQSQFLANLCDKTFFLRVYAWWEGGYMDCHNSKCPCRQPGGAMHKGLDEQRCIFTGLAHGGEMTIEGNTRYMDCQIHDYMKIMQDQYFLNSPFFDGMNDYFAVALISHLAGFSENPLGSDPYAPAELIDETAKLSVQSDEEWNKTYKLTGETLFFLSYTLPSSYDILQNPFMKFGDGSKFDEALTKIGTLAGKVAYFDRFGTFRYDVRPDARFLSKKGQLSRRPKCNFMASPYAMASCYNLDLMALNTYTYKRSVQDVVNDILLVTATPQGEVLVNSILSLPGRYDPSTPGYVGYTKRMLQMDGIFGSQAALESIGKYYSSIMFKPPIIVNWESMGVSHLQAMDIITFTGLSDDIGFPPSNVEKNSDNSTLHSKTVTLVVTSLSGEINARGGEWRNKYEGEWLYGDVPK